MNLDSRVRRIETRLTPAPHPLLDDPEVAALAADLARVIPLGKLMQDAIAARDAAALRHWLDKWEDLERTLEHIQGREDVEALLADTRAREARGE